MSNNDVHTGKVKWFDDRKGFGFISSPDVDGDVFVHFSTVPGQEGRRSLMEGDTVTYILGERDGGMYAEKVLTITRS